MKKLSNLLLAYILIASSMQQSFSQSSVLLLPNKIDGTDKDGHSFKYANGYRYMETFDSSILTFSKTNLIRGGSTSLFAYTVFPFDSNVSIETDTFKVYSFDSTILSQSVADGSVSSVPPVTSSEPSVNLALIAPLTFTYSNPLITNKENDVFASEIIETTGKITGNNPFNSISFFPNPSSGFFSVTGETLTIENFEITVYDVLGHVVFYRSLKNNIGNFRIEININGDGIYILQLSNGKESITEKVVIQR